MSKGNEKNVIVVGGGLAGLSCAMVLADLGVRVTILSLVSVKRSHSVCAQGGINGAVDLTGEDDSPVIHAYDTIKGGDFLADQPPVLEMCFNAPGIIRMLDRMGVPFNRTPEGNLDFRRFGGTLYKRTAFSGASTGQQLLYALDEQVRRLEAAGWIKKLEHHEFLQIVLDENDVCRGIIAVDLMHAKTLISLSADGVVIAVGGAGSIFRSSTNSVICTGAASGRLFQKGVLLANPEFIQVHPTAIPGLDKCRLMSESARGEGGRIWVWGDEKKRITTPDGSNIPCGKSQKKWYFLEELYPAFGNLVPRDIASRVILQVVGMGLGIDGKNQVYLDLTHLPESSLHKLESILELYRKFTGDDPRKVPMKIFPAVHYTMGGLWVDWPATDDDDRMHRYRHMTNKKGLFACGECDFQFHGGNRLGANALLACIFSGMVTGHEMKRFTLCQSQSDGGEEKLLKEAEEKERLAIRELIEREGEESVYALYDTFSSLMMKDCTVVRDNSSLKKCMEELCNVDDRCQRIVLRDKGSVINHELFFAYRLLPMMAYGRAIVQGAYDRNESRGAHFKSDFPARNDTEWLKTTIAEFCPQTRTSIISYRSVDMRHVDPVMRDYTKAKKFIPKLKQIPEKIPLVTKRNYVEE